MIFVALLAAVALFQANAPASNAAGLHSAEDTPAKLDLETMTQTIHFATSLVHGVATRPRGP